MAEYNLHTQILAHVTDNSGGMKFTELVSILTSNAVDNGVTLPDKFADEVESVIRNSEELRVLDYTWKTLNRAKMFVYTP